jgi:hypothetical protein
MMSGHDVPMMGGLQRVEVVTGLNRRRWSPQAKAQLVAETYSTSVGEVAERYNVARNQLFAWRGRAKRSGMVTDAFVCVEVTDAADGGSAIGHGVIELQVGSVGMRIPQGADPAMVATVLASLRGNR